MAGEGKIRQIWEFRSIDGVVSEDPGANENNKLLSWNNSSKVFDYVLVGENNIDITYFTAFITAIFNGLTTDDYLQSIQRPVGSNYGQFTLKSGTNLYLPLGALAWEDTVSIEDLELNLPGNTKVLFDDNDTFGGENEFTYNKTTNKLQFQGTGLVFDLVGGTEGIYKEGLKYLGNYSWAVGNGVNSIQSGYYNFIGGYKAGYGLGSTSLRNLILGPFAGELCANNLEGSVFIGPYSGRYENVSNKFFLDNIDHGDTTTARSDSFMYADLAVERRLYIRDRLSVEKEGKFGYSGLSDAEGEYGMYQMSAASGGIPEWHDGSVWQPFANGINTYLTNVSYTAGNLLFTLSDASTVGPVDISDVNTTTFATSPSSPATGQTANSDYGYIQISNNSFTNNEGFTYVNNLRYNNTQNTLVIPQAIQLTPTTSTSYPNGSVYQDGTHAYINIGGSPVQIDNVDAAEDSIEGINLGDGIVEWYYTKDNDGNFLFRTFDTIPLGNTYNPNDRIHLAYTDNGYTAMIGTTAERNRLSTTIDNPATDVQIEKDNVGETLHIRALRQGTGVTLTQTENYILIDATGAGGGEVNTASNLGTGIEFWAYKNGADLEFFTLKTTDSRIDLVQATDRVTDQENEINLDLTLQGSNTSSSTGLTYEGEIFDDVTGPTGNTPTYNFNTLVSNSISIDSTTVAGECRIEYAGTNVTGTNNGGGTIEVFDSTSVMPDFEFNTIQEINNHLTIVNNAGLLKFDVDDLTYTYNGTGLELLAGTSGFEIISKGVVVVANSGLDLSSSTINDIIIDQTIPIPYFAETVSGTLDSSNSGSDSTTIIYNFTFDSDVRDGVYTGASTKFFELNIGNGLSYDEATNTLSSTTSAGLSGDDHYLKSVSIDSSSGINHVLTFTVDNPLGTDPISVTGSPLNIPIYQLPIADNTNTTGSTGELGGVKVYDAGFVWEESAGTMNHLSLDEVTGKLSILQKLVTYDTQNNLLDEDNSETGLTTNPLRQQARANIGAAYAEGNVSLDFNTKDLNVTGEITATTNPTTSTHSIGNININSSAIFSNGNNLGIGTSENNVDNNISTVKVGTKSTFVYIDGDSSGQVYIYAHKSGGDELLFRLTSDGDLYIKGNIYAGQDIEAFDTGAAGM